jgi:hypothetical protein
MDALQNFFFWTWKIGNSTQLGTSSSPMWHYQLGLQQGWIPKGEILLCLSEIPRNLNITPLSLSRRSKRSHRTLRPNSDLVPNFRWKLSFLSDWRRECPLTAVPAFVIQLFVRQLLIIIFLEGCWHHCPSAKHITHIPPTDSFSLVLGNSNFFVTDVYADRFIEDLVRAVIHSCSICNCRLRME